MVHFSNSIEKALANRSEAMEAGDHFKNGASSKSLTSRINFIIFVCLIFFGASSSYARETRARIAVVGQTDLCSSPTVFHLNRDIVNTNQFAVIDLSIVEQVLNERGIQNNQCAINASAIEIGNLLEVDKILTVSVLWSDEGRTILLNLIDVESGITETVVSAKQKWRWRIINWRVVRAINNPARLTRNLVDELLS